MKYLLTGIQIGVTEDWPRNFQPNEQRRVNNNFSQNSRDNVPTNKILQPSQTTQHVQVIKHTFEELKIKIENPDITPDELEKFRALITEFGDVLAMSNAEIEGTYLLEYEIQVQHDSRPISRVRNSRGKKTIPGIPGIIPRNSVLHSGNPPLKRKILTCQIIHL